jgi:hypothetical protein
MRAYIRERRLTPARRKPVPAGIFVVWDGMGLVAKRVEHELDADRPKLMVNSVNSEYENCLRDVEEAKIVGREVREFLGLPPPDATLEFQLVASQ